MNKFQKNIFPCIRIIIYIVLIMFFIFTPTEKFEGGKSICMLYSLTGRMCPACGVTRAFSCFLHLNFLKAFNYNPFFTTSVFPICLFLMADDGSTYIKRLISKKETKSLVENLII